VRFFFQIIPSLDERNVFSVIFYRIIAVKKFRIYNAILSRFLPAYEQTTGGPNAQTGKLPQSWSWPRSRLLALRTAPPSDDGRRRPPPPSPLARPQSSSSKRGAQLAAPPKTRSTEEGQPPRTARLLRVVTRSRGSLVTGRGQRRGICSGEVGGVDPPSGRGRGRGGPGAGAQAHLRRRGHAHLPVRGQTAHLPPLRRPARQAGTLRPRPLLPPLM
jgi:hypothetical protein